MLCQERIILGIRRETYCMRKLNHAGEHDIKPHPEDHEFVAAVEPQKEEPDAPASK
jgi:hypothetical protein